ncbi:hypothetical protein EVAR_42535_1 [Eumeta japonica]|uniref:Reverse transcriptase domain-containing protein n=1 Tax=Eumeta variegata TaxID=151549 RepID=A0A4C1WUK2_EUMVA|nr:hypothetical protein EVAR_42535_1 [Eumeta japonica]
MEGRVPDVWKEGSLVVLPKGNGKHMTDPKAYRPLTVLTVFGKTLKRFILRWSSSVLSSFLDSQHSFTKGRPTVTALTAMLNSVRTSTRKCAYGILGHLWNIRQRLMADNTGQPQTERLPT